MYALNSDADVCGCWYLRRGCGAFLRIEIQKKIPGKTYYFDALTLPLFRVTAVSVILLRRQTKRIQPQGYGCLCFARRKVKNKITRCKMVNDLGKLFKLHYIFISSIFFFFPPRANSQMKMEKYYKLFSFFFLSVFQSEIRYSFFHISCRKNKENREFSLHSAEKLCPFAQFNTSASALAFEVSLSKENIFNFVYLKAAEFLEWRVHRVINKRSGRIRRR